mmetsp:Transcript_13998/g.26141  ORF Transcript_13998/g.26141 Transcript_13998/m.26141 type:complete len:273 (-) Transcript_13998:237-1055(-)
MSGTTFAICVYGYGMPHCFPTQTRCLLFCNMKASAPATLCSMKPLLQTWSANTSSKRRQPSTRKVWMLEQSPENGCDVGFTNSSAACQSGLREKNGRSGRQLSKWRPQRGGLPKRCGRNEASRCRKFNSTRAQRMSCKKFCQHTIVATLRRSLFATCPQRGGVRPLRLGRKRLKQSYPFTTRPLCRFSQRRGLGTTCLWRKCRLRGFWHRCSPSARQPVVANQTHWRGYQRQPTSPKKSPTVCGPFWPRTAPRVAPPWLQWILLQSPRTPRS